MAFPVFEWFEMKLAEKKRQIIGKLIGDLSNRRHEAFCSTFAQHAQDTVFAHAYFSNICRTNMTLA
jgi:hypothetical protein